MNRKNFIEKKEKLIELVKYHLSKKELPEHEINSLETLLTILGNYSYDNRLQKKGLLSYTIIDSLELEYALAEELIKFDNELI